MAVACRLRVSAKRALGPAACAVMRPILATSTIRSRVVVASHSPQRFRPGGTGAPQPRHTFSGRGAGLADGNDGRLFASRLLLCVSRVAIGLSGLRIVDQNARATHSAYGATARPQVGAVWAMRAANDPIRRQFPSRCSKNHSRLSGWLVTQSSTYASHCARTGSIRKCDAVLVDYEMPGMNGDEVALAIKRLRPELLVILLSGSDVPRHALASVDAFVPKLEASRQLLPVIAEFYAQTN
jgi:CheY-like chemotaxis protein